MSPLADTVEHGIDSLKRFPVAYLFLASAGAYLFLASAGPLGYVEVANRAQFNRLKRLLTRNNLLAGNVIVLPEPPPLLSPLDLARLKNLGEYFREDRHLKFLKNELRFTPDLGSDFYVRGLMVLGLGQLDPEMQKAKEAMLERQASADKNARAAKERREKAEKKLEHEKERARLSADQPLIMTDQAGQPSAQAEASRPAVENFVPPDGEEGLREALRLGLLKPADSSEYRQWNEARLARQNREAAATGQQAADAAPETRFGWSAGAYLIMSERFVIPRGLAGAKSVTFFLPAGLPPPRGDLGRSKILFLDEGRCLGPGCRLGPGS